MIANASSWNPGTPLRCGPDLVGYEQVTPGGHKRVSGTFMPGPGFEAYRSTFERVRELYRRVDESSAEGYQGAWQGWSEALKDIDRLGLRFGEPGVAIEEFEMDSDWRVEFNLEGWWFPELGSGETSSLPPVL